MRDAIVDAVRGVPGRRRGAGPAPDPATGDAFCAGMDLARVDRGAGRQPRASTPAPPPRRCASACRRSSASCGSSTSRRSPRCNGAAVGPGAHLALACDFVLVRPGTKFLWSFATLGPRRRRGRRLPAPPPGRAAPGQGDGDARRGRDGAEAVDLGLAYRCVGTAEDAARGGRGAGRAARRRTRPGRSACRSGCSTSFETDLAHASSSRATSSPSPPRRRTSWRAWPPSRRSGRPTSPATDRATRRTADLLYACACKH